MLRVSPSPPRSGFIEPCLPSAAERPPTGPDWVHEIKHDGYRMMARRDPIGVRLLTRNGHDWADRYPAITSPVIPEARLHVATFDSGDGAQYNSENCQAARDLFQQQPGVQTTFWCEKGRFRQ
jgi:hypothetical protein